MTALSPRAATILAGVLTAMQPAEEMGGPDDYIALMQAIIDAATERKGACIFLDSLTNKGNTP